MKTCDQNKYKKNKKKWVDMVIGQCKSTAQLKYVHGY